MRPIALFFLATVAVISRAEAQEGGSHELPGIIIGNDKNKGSDNNAAPEPLAPAPAPKNSGKGSGKPSGGGTANGPGAATCTGKESDPAEAMKCLNEQMKGQADKVNPTINSPPIDAKSGDTKTGVINIPGVQQQYGKNFGISAAPFRPPPQTFTAPPPPPPTTLGIPVNRSPVGIPHR